MRLQLSNNVLSCIGIQHAQLKKAGITISDNKMVGTDELKGAVAVFLKLQAAGINFEKLLG